MSMFFLWLKILPQTYIVLLQKAALFLLFKPPCFTGPCCLVARSSSSLARSGLPLLAKQWASWEALGWCVAAGSPLLHMAKAWKAWVDRLSPARSFTSWAALRRRRRARTRRATSSSESSPDNQRRRESERESGGRAGDDGGKVGKQ